MNFTDSDNIGKDYKNFVLLSIDDLPDYKTKGIYLRHKTTGLEVYHILAEDKENLFAFAFRTVSKDSLGTAHIMEHSTLCGSEKYPLKEPFNTLASTSLNTYLNALTYPDKTVYPGASVVTQDYFNMMDVYADCVFFPKLDHATFLQEGHRLELDEKGKVSIQGVVYNEMKGNYTSFPPIAYDQLISAMFPESYPSFDSGGDPINIPELTYEKFLEFHQKFYNPDNCLLFLYGDIPTDKQLDFIDERFIERIEKKYGKKEDCVSVNSDLPCIKPEISELLKLNKQTESCKIKNYAPEEGSTGSLVTMNWYTGEVDIEKYYLSEVLCGNDSSPISKALKDSKLGDDLSCGNFGQFREEFFTLGLLGVKKDNENKVYELINNTLSNIVEKGISQEDIDSAIMGIDFNLREVNRYFGPQSIPIMEKVLKCWCHGKKCNSSLSPITNFELLKQKIRADKDFTVNLVKKYFIDNKQIIKFVSEPSSTYFKERNKKEADLIKSLEVNLDKEQLKKDLDELHAYQQHIETPEETSCIPSTKLESLDSNIKFPETKLEFIETQNGTKVPYFINEEDTNGIFYIDVLFPFDNIAPEKFKHISYLANIITNMGWNNKNWNDCISESACIMGDVWGRTLWGQVPEMEEFQKVAGKYKEYNFCGRAWLGISCKALTEQAEKTLNMLSEIITKMDFKDLDRFNSLITEMKADKKAEFISNGRSLALRRVKSALTLDGALAEILSGITEYETVWEYTKKNSKKTLELFKQIYEECLQNGGIVHITADSESLKKINPLIKNFVQDSDIKPLVPAKNLTVEQLIPHMSHPELISGNINEQDIKTKSQTGYAVCATKASPSLTKEAAAEIVFTSWFSNHSLWDKIRTTGGAYGAHAVTQNDSELCLMASYRDPNPVNTLKVFKDSLKEVSESVIEKEDVEKTVVSCFGDAIVPLTAKEKGARSFENLLYGCDSHIKNMKVDRLLEVTQDDVTKAAKRLADWSEDVFRTSVFCDNSVKTCGNIIKINL